MGTVPMFDLDTGRLCLDFANTIGHRKVDPPEEEGLHSYADLVAFGQQAGVLSDAAAADHLREAAAHPAAAAHAFAEAVAFREALYRVFSAVAAERDPAAADLAAINAAFAAAVATSRITPDGAGGVRWEWPGDDTAAWDAMLRPVAWSAAELLRDEAALARVRECASHACSWLFIDMSKNGSRRWCSMQTCGNRAKARRHRTRQGVAAHGM